MEAKTVGEELAVCLIVIENTMNNQVMKRHRICDSWNYTDASMFVD